MRQAWAKLNLYLHILSARADGYHDLESLVAFTDLADSLTVEPAKTLSLEVVGEFADSAGPVKKNLVMKAAELLRGSESHGVRLILNKQIPAGAGLGGGSADAAAALQLLNAYWKLDLPPAVLKKLGQKLGADVAMCLDSTPAVASGVGDRLTPLAEPLPAMHAVLAYPNQPLSTAQVYGLLTEERRITKDAERRRKKRPPAEEGDLFPPSKDHSFAAFVARLSKTRNDLQRAAIMLMPKVAEVLLALETAPGAKRFVRMSGSGSSCFALMEKQADAAALVAQLSGQYPDWWVRAVAVKR